MSDPYSPRSTADLDDTPPAPHLIHNVCRDAGGVLLFGRTGIGKTRLLWQLACGWGRGEAPFGLAPRKPLRITIVEADMYRSDFESMIKEYAKAGITAPDNVCWFSRDDGTSYFVDGAFGKRLCEHNITWQTDLTMYDAVPDMTLGDPNTLQTAYATLRALAAASADRAYLGVLVQRKGSTQQSTEQESETIDNMLGSQGWGRQASTVWQMTSIPSLVWVKHRLCPKPRSIILTRGDTGIIYSRTYHAELHIRQEAAKGYASVNDLALRLANLPAYAMVPQAYKDRALRELITDMISQAQIPPPSL